MKDNHKRNETSSYSGNQHLKSIPISRAGMSRICRSGQLKSVQEINDEKIRTLI